jgi:hypothetical protein
VFSEFFFLLAPAKIFIETLFTARLDLCALGVVNWPLGTIIKDRRLEWRDESNEAAERGRRKRSELSERVKNGSEAKNANIEVSSIQMSGQ